MFITPFSNAQLKQNLSPLSLAQTLPTGRHATPLVTLAFFSILPNSATREKRTQELARGPEEWVCICCRRRAGLIGIRHDRGVKPHVLVGRDGGDIPATS